MNIKDFCSKFEQLKVVRDEICAMERTISAQGEHISRLESAIQKSGYKLEQISEGVYELVKDETQATPPGDYLNPIAYKDGIEVVKGLWYTDGNNVWEAVSSGIPTGFDDAEYFDIITQEETI